MRKLILATSLLAILNACKSTVSSDPSTSAVSASPKPASRPEQSLAYVGPLSRLVAALTKAEPADTQAFSFFIQGQTQPSAECGASASGGGETGCITPPDTKTVHPDFGGLLPKGVDVSLGCSEITLEVGQTGTLVTTVATNPSSYLPAFATTPLLFSYVAASPLQSVAIDKRSITVRAGNVTANTRVIVTSELGWNVPGEGAKRVHCDHVVNVRPVTPPVPPPRGSLACVVDATQLAPGASAKINIIGSHLVDPTSYRYENIALENIGSLTPTGSGLVLQTSPSVSYALSDSERTLVVTATSRDAYGELQAVCPAILVRATPRPPTQLSCATAPTLGANDKSYDFPVAVSGDATSVRLVGLTEAPSPNAPAIPGKASLIPVGPGQYIVRYTAAFAKSDTEFRIALEADGNTHAIAECVGTKLGNPYGPENGWIEPRSYVSCFAPQPVIALPSGSGFALVTSSGGWTTTQRTVSAVAPHAVELLQASGGYLVKLKNPAEWTTGEQVHVTSTFGSATDTCHFVVQSGDGGTIPPPQYPVVQCESQNLLLQTRQSGLLQYETKGQPTSPAPAVTIKAYLADDPSFEYQGALGRAETIAVGDTTTVKYTAMDQLARDVLVKVRLAAHTGEAECTIRVSKDINLGVVDDGKTVGLVGNVWALPAHTNTLSKEPPNTAPLLTVVMDTPRVYDRSWSSGFPGVAVNALPPNHGHCTMVTDRNAPDYGKCRLDEWFQIRFRGVMLLTQSGRHCFKTQSDDGIAFRVDGIEVFANRPIHAPTWNEFCVNLSAGAHDVILDYMQGPRVRIACAMQVKFPGSSTFVEAPASLWARGLGN